MEFKKELIVRLAKEINTVEGLKGQAESAKAYKFEDSICCAMVCDICETLYGHQANGSPDMMSATHASFVCGPVSKKNNEIFVEWVYRMNKIIPDSRQEKRINNWKEFLNKLNKSIDKDDIKIERE